MSLLYVASRVSVERRKCLSTFCKLNNYDNLDVFGEQITNAPQIAITMEPHLFINKIVKILISFGYESN